MGITGTVSAASRIAGLVIALLVGVANAKDLRIELAGTPSVVYDPARDACTPNDVPDMNTRAFHDASGSVTAFSLHYVNRPLKGPDLLHLKIDCHVSLDSPRDPEPAHFAGLFYVASIWTRDGHDISALIHDEYHAQTYKRCRFSEDLACWYNSILAFHSGDDGATFAKASPTVVAAAPFTQDVEQGRHRGFFDPSNMFGDGRYVYVFVTTTGWTGQNAGACLFRSLNPANSALWRAFDGVDFTIQYSDPYQGATHPRPCKVIEPFHYAVGSVVRHIPSGLWLATFQAHFDALFPINGFYYATSRDLLTWSQPHLLTAGQTLYGDWCKPEAYIINYPSLLDPQSPSRNFDTIGDHPLLFYTTMQVRNCQTAERMLLRQTINLRVVDGNP